MNPACRRTAMPWASTGLPNSQLAPSVGSGRPLSILIVEVLPQPFRPRKPKPQPRGLRKLTLPTAGKSPKCWGRRKRDESTVTIAGPDAGQKTLRGAGGQRLASAHHNEPVDACGPFISTGAVITLGPAMRANAESPGHDEFGFDLRMKPSRAFYLAASPQPSGPQWAARARCVSSATRFGQIDNDHIGKGAPVQNECRHKATHPSISKIFILLLFNCRYLQQHANFSSRSIR